MGAAGLLKVGATRPRHSDDSLGRLDPSVRFWPEADIDYGIREQGTPRSLLNIH